MLSKEEVAKRFFRKGKKKAVFYYRLHCFLDSALAKLSRPLGMCKEKWFFQARYNAWQKFTRRFSQLFWNECDCCFFYRGVTLGFLFAVVLMAAYWVISSLL